ncbi:MAG: hypothetical protein FJ304_25735 [Planctomycetes bacterium]|nr:hypothetical protein [Planctomycetota bacterium]
MNALREAGRLFLILDSFDELPHLLDEPEGGARHQAVCAALNTLFRVQYKDCRVILASRPYREPKEVRAGRVQVRPLSDTQMHDMLRTRMKGKGVDPEGTIQRVYQNCPELVPLLKNPFTAELLTKYTIDTGG